MQPLLHAPGLLAHRLPTRLRSGRSDNERPRAFTRRPPCASIASSPMRSARDVQEEGGEVRVWCARHATCSTTDVAILAYLVCSRTALSIRLRIAPRTPKHGRRPCGTHEARVLGAYFGPGADWTRCESNCLPLILPSLSIRPRHVRIRRRDMRTLMSTSGLNYGVDYSPATRVRTSGTLPVLGAPAGCDKCTWFPAGLRRVARMRHGVENAASSLRNRTERRERARSRCLQVRRRKLHIKFKTNADTKLACIHPRVLRYECIPQ